MQLDARKRAILSIFKALVHISPILSLVSIALFFWLPTTVQERFFVDEHAFPTVGVQHRLDLHNRATQQQQQNLKLSSSSTKEDTFSVKRNIKISDCFTASYRMHSSSTFSTNDLEPKTPH
jgi:hypothetical protein